MKITAKMIAEAINGKIIGDEKSIIIGFSKIEDTKQDTISFINSDKYLDYLKSTKASVIIINNKLVEKITPKKEVTFIAVEDAFKSIVILMQLYSEMIATKIEPIISVKADIHKSAQVASDCYVGSFAVIGSGSSVKSKSKIYEHVYIGNNVQIGNNTTIYPGVKIYDNCVIGNNCIIHAGTVIGADGFGYIQQENINIKVPHLGNVIIGNDVEIGANCTIDRATMGSTEIANGVKLDNLIHLAHNCYIGENTLIASQTGIAGSTTIGENCMIGGQVGMIDHIKIGNNVKIIAKSGLMKEVKDNEIVMGAPAYNYRDFMRSYNLFKKLANKKD